MVKRLERVTKSEFAGILAEVGILAVLVLAVVEGQIRMSDLSAALAAVLLGAMVAVGWWAFKPRITRWLGRARSPEGSRALIKFIGTKDGTVADSSVPEGGTLLEDVGGEGTVVMRGGSVKGVPRAGAPRLEILYEPERSPPEYCQSFDLPDEKFLGGPLLDPVTMQPIRHRGTIRYVRVLNNGAEPAERCDASLEILPHPQGCTALTPGTRWLIIDEFIKPGLPSVAVPIVTADSKNRYKVDGNCLRSESGECLLVAYIAVKGTAQNQDGMCPGEYDVVVRVRDSKGRGASRPFRISVFDDWRRLDMEALGPSVPTEPTQDLT